MEANDFIQVNKQIMVYYLLNSYIHFTKIYHHLNYNLLFFIICDFHFIH